MAITSGGKTILALSRDGLLSLVVFDDGGLESKVIDEDAGRACIEHDENGRLHLAFEKRQGIEYRQFEIEVSGRKPTLKVAERVAEAFGSHPTLLAHDGRVILAYLGESCRLPSISPGSEAWERLGRGGFIAALVYGDNIWKRYRLADSRQIVKPLRPIDEAYGGGATVESRLRIEEFSAPAVSLGPDGVPQILWADTERRWIYGSRLLGEQFSSVYEVRGPFEQLTGPCLLPRRIPENFSGIPIGIVTKTRIYLDRIVLPNRSIENGHRIDFVQLDSLAEAQGLEAATNQMTRRLENPVIPVGESGARDDGAIVANIFREDSIWHADIMYITAKEATPNSKTRGWRSDGLATSVDGIHWTKSDPVPLEKRTLWTAWTSIGTQSVS